MMRRTPEQERVIAYLRSLIAPVPRRIRPPRERHVLSYPALLRGIFMFRPRLGCTVCGSQHVRPSSTPLPRRALIFGLAPYRCLECDHLLALPFKT